MAEQSTFLDKIGVAAPCDASWDGMRGDERVRYCGSCRLSVYNLSAMSRREAEDLVRNRHGAGEGGQLCVKFFRRADGTLVTDECGRVRRALRRKALLIRAAAAAVFAFVLTPLLAACGAGGENPAPQVVSPAAPAPVLPTPDQPVPDGAAPAPQLQHLPVEAPVSFPMQALGRMIAPQSAPAPPEPIEMMGEVCAPELQPDETQPPEAPSK